VVIGDDGLITFECRGRRGLRVATTRHGAGSLVEPYPGMRYKHHMIKSFGDRKTAGKLRGDLRGFHSIRINDQWRIIFRWVDGHAHDVAVVDYH
jgi:RelE-like toxin of type II toxin-antitoxin system HigB